MIRLDRFDLLILDDFSYVRRDQVFPEAAMTVAAVDRLVHHSTIFEPNVASYRRKAAEGKVPTKVKVSPRK